MLLYATFKPKLPVNCCKNRQYLWSLNLLIAALNLTVQDMSVKIFGHMGYSEITVEGQDN